MNDLHNGYYDVYQVLLFSKLTDDNLSLNQQSVLSALERWLEDTLPDSSGLPTEVKAAAELVLSKYDGWFQDVAKDAHLKTRNRPQTRRSQDVRDAFSSLTKAKVVVKVKL